MAQLGACVPAAAMRLSPVDAMFVRMGARDQIIAGRSTFLVELNEAAAVLRGATASSLVALDELGRGTATTDGAAIASAVLRHITRRLRCRALFSTHYHRLAEDHGADPEVCCVFLWEGGAFRVFYGRCSRGYSFLQALPQPRGGPRADPEGWWALRAGKVQLFFCGGGERGTRPSPRPPLT